MLRSGLFLFLAFMISGCAASREQFQAQSCNRETGYERGMNDGRENKPMDSSAFGICEGATRQAAMQGYRDGYETARREQAEKGIKADESGVRVKLPGVDINLPNKTATTFTCEVVANGHTFTAVGPTRAAAEEAARSSCLKKNPQANCGRMGCNENR